MLVDGWLEDEIILMATYEIKQHFAGFPWESQFWHRVADRRSPYRALILFGLSSRTTDKILVKTCRRFFGLFPDLASLLESYLPQRPVVEKFVRRGQMPFVESTVKTLGQCGGVVPMDRARLLQINGVGEKIAECVLAYGWGQPALPLDGNACRVVERISGADLHGKSRNVARIRDGLKTLYSNHRPWMDGNEVALIDVHELLRLHGQLVCGKRPNCARCPVSRCRSRKDDYSECGSPELNASLWQDWRDLLLEPAAPAPTPGPGTRSRSPNSEGLLA